MPSKAAATTDDATTENTEGMGSPFRDTTATCTIDATSSEAAGTFCFSKATRFEEIINVREIKPIPIESNLKTAAPPMYFLPKNKLSHAVGSTAIDMQIGNTRRTMYFIA